MYHLYLYKTGEPRPNTHSQVFSKRGVEKQRDRLIGLTGVPAAWWRQIGGFQCIRLQPILDLHHERDWWLEIYEGKPVVEETQDEPFDLNAWLSGVLRKWLARLDGGENSATEKIA